MPILIVFLMICCRYDITHSGLDAMVTRYLNDMVVFANLPNEIAFANHSR